MIHVPDNPIRRNTGERLVRTACLLTSLLLTMPASFAQQGAATPADRLLKHIDDNVDIEQDLRDLIRKNWIECEDCDGEEFITAALAMYSVDFRGGLDAYDDDKYEACAEIMGRLATDEDPFIAVNAACYEVKALTALERQLEAGQRINALRVNGDKLLKDYSYFAPEMAFLEGYCALADLDYEKAVVALSNFLRDYGESSQRLVLSAQQILAELQTRQPGRIGDVVDLMTYSARRLKNDDSTDPVRERQRKIIELLDKLIKDAEQQEQSSSSSGGSGSGGGNRSGQTPSSPMQDSSLPGGPASGEKLREHRRANPGESWGAMPEAQREEILQALKDSFPGQYRRLVEQYYAELAKKR